jgi:hypothetical protein
VGAGRKAAPHDQQDADGTEGPPAEITVISWTLIEAARYR